MRTDVVAEGLKAAPPVAVTAISLAAELTLNQAVAIVTIVYVLLQGAYLLWKWVREWRAERNRRVGQLLKRRSSDAGTPPAKPDNEKGD